MNQRRWVSSGIREELDARQQRLLDRVLDRVKFYYRELHGTASRYQHPLSLSLLMRLTNRNSYAVLGAVRILSNSISYEESEPPIYYDRIASEKNASHRPYRILLRNRR